MIDIKSIFNDSQPDFYSNLSETKARVDDAAKESKPVNDSYGNTLSSIGTSDKVSSFTTYGFSNDTLNWTLWLSLYNDSWVFRRAIDKPAQDEVRAGITLHGTSDFSKVYKKLKEFRSDLIQLLQWGALYGGSIACIMLNNCADEDYAKPISIDKLKSAKTIRMYVVDRWYGLQASDELVSDMSDLDFGKPVSYTITLGDGKMVKFHHSWVLRYEHRVAPKLVKNGMLQGWGYAEGSHIINELARDDNLKAAATSLVNKSLIEVIKMSGMRGVFMGADSDNEQQLRKRLEMVNWGRTYNSLTFLDKDDDYQMSTFSVAGLADLLQQNMWLVSSALEMQGVLFGDLKSGFSNDENALERYDETINNRCESYFRPVMTKLLSILFSKFDISEPVDYEFNSLLIKQHSKEEMEGMNSYIDLLSKLLNDGVITLKQYAKAVNAYSKDRTISISFTDEELNALDDKMEEEFEEVKIDG